MLSIVRRQRSASVILYKLRYIVSERRECLGRGLLHQNQVLGSIHNANKDNTTDAHLKRKGSSLQKFERAETFCSAPLPHPLWDHYYVDLPSLKLLEDCLNTA
jgi:hypothetical protein